MEKKRTLWQRFYHEFEHFTDHVIPILVILLAVVLILENPLWTLLPVSHYEPWITIFDETIVFFFVADLVFKWVKTRNIRRFFRLYWIDMIAVFPFYLAFRAYAEVAAVFRIGEEVSETGQKLAHEAVLLREAKTLAEAEQLAKQARLLREAEAVGMEAKIAREASMFTRITRPIQNAFRLLKGRLYTSHRALVAIHKQHEKEHKQGY
jgi:hypothetical protein